MSTKTGQLQAARRSQAVEADLLGAWDQQDSRCQALALRHRADYMAAQRPGAVVEAVQAICDRERKQLVKENRHEK